jgi:hypothetical protein
LRLTTRTAEGAVAERTVDLRPLADVDALLVGNPLGGVVVAAFTCSDPECEETQLAVRGFGSDGPEISPTEIEWQSDPIFSDVADAPRWGGASDTAVAIRLFQQIVRIDAEGVTSVEVPEDLTGACLTPEDRLLAIQTPVADLPDDRVTEIPEEPGADRLAFSVHEEAGGTWSELADSTLSLAPAELEDFRCGSGGLEHAAEDQTASYVWNGGWQQQEPRTFSWQLTSRSQYAGLVGVLDGSVVLLDSASGEPQLSVPVPAELGDLLEPTPDAPEPAAFAAIGGTAELPVAALCSTVQDDEGQIACHVL